MNSKEIYYVQSVLRLSFVNPFLFKKSVLFLKMLEYVHNFFSFFSFFSHFLFLFFYSCNYSPYKHCSAKRFQHLRVNKAPSCLAGSMKCWTHNQSIHDFFLNYRVSSEGRKSPSSIAVWQEHISLAIIFSSLGEQF